MPKIKRRIFVGDIQGCREELERLLAEVRFDPDSDRLYAVGDIINRGPDSAGTVRLLRSLEAIVVLGNHELNYFEVLAGHHSMRKRDTLENLLNAPDHQVLRDWLLSRPILHLETDLMMVHAGVHPLWRHLKRKARDLRHTLDDKLMSQRKLDDPDLQFAVTVRYCAADGTLPGRELSVPSPLFLPWYDYYQGPRLIVFGHWAVNGLVRGKYVRGLDTGCVYGGQLTAWIAEEDRFVHVKAGQEYCPTND